MPVNVIALVAELLLKLPQYETMFHDVFDKVGGTGADFDAARAEAFRLAELLGHPAHYFTGAVQQTPPVPPMPPPPIEPGPPVDTPYRTLFANPIPSDADLVLRFGFLAGDDKYAADEAAPGGMWGVIKAGDPFGRPGNTRDLGPIEAAGDAEPGEPVTAPVLKPVPASAAKKK